MNRTTLLLRTPAVTLTSFDHEPDAPHADPEFEVSTRDSINYVYDGTFDVRMDGGSWTLGPETLFVAARGMGFSCTHDRDVPTDRCLSVVFAEDTVEELLRADVAPLRPPAVESSARHDYLLRRLRTCAPGDEVRLELLAGALFESVAPAAEPRHEDARAARLMRRVERAVELIEAEYGRALTLAELARAARMSTYHFARAFRALTGLPPHRYLTAVRLRHAARLLDQGASVTFTCYEVGFGSPSHFVTAFRKRYGFTPSEVRRGAPWTHRLRVWS